MGRLRARTLIAGMVVLATAGITPAATATTGIADQWSKPGPYAVTVEALDSTHTVYRPSRLEKHAVILWGNGTGANPKIYDGLLRHLASHGFVVAAADTPNAGSGKEMLAGATTLIAENSRPGSRYQGKIDTTRIGATGHSQGGGGAIAAGADPRVTTTIPIEPGPQGSATALKGAFVLPRWPVRHHRHSRAAGHPAVPPRGPGARDLRRTRRRDPLHARR